MYKHEIEQVKAILRLTEIPHAIFSMLILQQFHYGLSKEIFDVRAVIDTIKKIQEGNPIHIKGIRQFKNEPLKGFSYAHWFEAQFIPQNIINQWKMSSKKSNKCANQISKSIESTGVKKGDHITKEAIHQIARDIVGGFYHKARHNKLTGEWIIFHPRQDGNTIYLSLAQHIEDDAKIYLKMAKACDNDYPELFPKKKTERLTKKVLWTSL